MSDYLTDEEQLARLKSWWAENGTSTIVGLVLVIVGVVGWRWYDGYRDAAIAQASDLYEEFLASEGVARDTTAAKLASDAANSAYHTLALMYLARDAVGAGDYDVAEQHLLGAIDAAPEPELADVARLRLARVQQQGDRSDAALQTLGAIRGAGFRSHVAELKGDIHLARGERRLANESYAVASADAADQDRRPILEIKLADTADSAALQVAEFADEPLGTVQDPAGAEPVDVTDSAESTDDSSADAALLPDSVDPAEVPDA